MPLDLQTAQIEWQRLAPDASPVLTPEQLTDGICRAFLDAAASPAGFDPRPIDLLCRLTDSLDPALARAATEALYSHIIEGLCNDFTALGAATANQVLLRMLAHVRSGREGARLRQLLAATGYQDEQALLDRYERLKQRPPLTTAQRPKVRKIILLSRVTIGADIVIVSSTLQRLRQAFPAAGLVLIGPSHLPEILAGIPATRFHILDYQRYGSMAEKINVWPFIHDLVSREAAGYKADEVLVFDPDSRLTQLGLLPLLDEESTCYFDSRREPADGTNPSLVLLVNSWLDAILPDTAFCNPILSFTEAAQQAARSFMAGLPMTSTRIIMNLGVGQNEKKRLPAPFEAELLLALLEKPDCIVILDSGRSADNLARTERLLATARQHGLATAFVSETELDSRAIPFGHGAVGFKGSIGAIGALIGLAHGFFGYDSSCQHIAAALGTPSVIAFAGAPNLRFRERWRPYSPAGRNRTIMIDDTARLDAAAIRALARQVADDLQALSHPGPASRIS